MSTDEFVSLSVQGSLFVLKRDEVLSHKWMIATLVSTPNQGTLHNGILYVNVDPASFRVVFSVLQGLTTLDKSLLKMSVMELELLKASATYLLCDNIVAYIAQMQSDMAESACAAECMEVIKSGDYAVFMMECNGYKTFRTYNVCGRKTLIISSEIHAGRAGIECTDCNGDLLKYREDGKPKITRMKGSQVEDAIMDLK
ncbi:hypothetical protein BJ741DRAFT_652263 [Chytriomyces cf. hyalinus JEL632]|nr:hypothetical protein BJ741DRAFT_652263 [Chytriomyces cf. hyalinus JEL632]